MLFKKDKIYIKRRIMLSIISICIVSSVLLVGILSLKALRNDKSVNDPVNYDNLLQTSVSQTTQPEPEPIKSIVMEYPTMTSSTLTFDSNKVTSLNGVLIDVESNTILAQRDCNAKIYPASLTKIMTLIVAAENIKNYEDTFTMTNAILTPLINQNATRAGFLEGEKVKMIDMMYGVVLPSGADATVGLAEAISGSEENFVVLMNEKVQALGLKNTHFTNTSGLYDENNYSTVVDLAMMLKYAMQNELCRKILSTYKYTTSPTEQHPQGINLESTMFSRMYGNEVENVTIEGGKTGYTTEAGNCLASFAKKDVREYIAVTTNGTGKYKPIFDSFEIYRNYLK